MDLMKIAFKYKPDETKIVKKNFSEDMKINKLIKS